MKKKLMAMLVCTAMLFSVALPGTIAAGVDADAEPETVTAEQVDNVETVEPVEPTEPAEEKDKDGTEPAEEQKTPAEKADDPAEDQKTEQDNSAKKDLFDRLMACTSLKALYNIVDNTPKAELEALTAEENAKIEAKVAKLEPEPLPPVEEEEPEDEPVPSEIIYPTVNFDNVAPFGDPVVG